MHRYLDLHTDYGFKHVFAHEAILISFISAILPPEDHIVDLEYLSTEIRGGNPSGRTVIYDLRCLTADGRVIVVEVQRMPQPYFKERTLYYTMRGFEDQVRRGDDEYAITPVILIAVVDFELAGGYEGYFHHFTIQNARGELFSDVLQLYFVVLPKMPAVDTTATLDPLEQWAEVIRRMPALDGIPEWVTDEDIKRAFEVSEVANLSTEERAKWDRALREDRDLRGQVLQQYIYGKMQGKEEGREEGREEGFDEGFASTVRLLFASGMPSHEIAGRLKVDVSVAERILAADK